MFDIALLSTDSGTYDFVRMGGIANLNDVRSVCPFSPD
jgi:hypothetical protein